MSVLKISAFKCTYREFLGYNGSGDANFSDLEHMRVLGSFDTEVSAARYVVDVLIKNWNNANGTLPDHFRVESKATDKIYLVRLADSGETPDLTSPSQGDWIFQAVHIFKG